MHDCACACAGEAVGAVAARFGWRAHTHADGARSHAIAHETLAAFTPGRFLELGEATSFYPDASTAAAPLPFPYLPPASCMVF